MTDGAHACRGRVLTRKCGLDVEKYALPSNMRQTLPLRTRPWQIANRNKEVCKGKACTDGKLYNKSPFCR